MTPHYTDSKKAPRNRPEVTARITRGVVLELQYCSIRVVGLEYKRRSTKVLEL